MEESEVIRYDRIKVVSGRQDNGAEEDISEEAFTDTDASS